MKVVQISPTYFDNSSVLGGGERYPMALAEHMAEIVDTTLISFSQKRSCYYKNNLKVEIYPVKYFILNNKVNPLTFRHLPAILNADVIHLHQINTLVSDLGAITAFTLGKRAYVTDHGMGLGLTLNRYLPVFRCYSNVISQSSFTLDLIPETLRKKAVLIKGGVDTNKFCPCPSLEKDKKIIYVGRILPHKGVNYLIEAFRILNRLDYKLKIIGKVYNNQFYQDLKQMANGLRVEFIHDADDQQLLYEYCTALVTVLPSVHTNGYGGYTPVPELMGLTLLESQACGTPVICTDAGAMHEFVDHERTGFVVKQNSGEAIAAALCSLVNLAPSDYGNYRNRCREWVKAFSWSTVVQKHLEIYSSN